MYQSLKILILHSLKNKKNLILKRNNEKKKTLET